ncbi:MAG: hypothetical protein QOD41_3958 [Cryptosporangiaceae bacterium]|nr:hypothetical protein [Cryptosporangiaceae bacterium]
MTLRDRQEALVAALVAGGPLPDGFSPEPVQATAAALAQKRSGEVAKAWPALAAALGPDLPSLFTAWAAGRAPAGSAADGWAFARSLGADLPERAAGELAAAEVRFVLGPAGVRRRSGPALRRVPGGVVLQIFGRIVRLGR